MFPQNPKALKKKVNSACRFSFLLYATHTSLPPEPNALSGAVWVFGKIYHAVIIIRRGGHRNIKEIFDLLESENDI